MQAAQLRMASLIGIAFSPRFWLAADAALVACARLASDLAASASARGWEIGESNTDGRKGGIRRRHNRDGQIGGGAAVQRLTFERLVLTLPHIVHPFLHKKSKRLMRRHTKSGI